MHPILYFIAAYTVGAIPTGYLAARLTGRPSIFLPGERTPCYAGDVYKILGMPLGIFVTFLDVLKGCVVVWPLVDLMMGPGNLLPWWVVAFGGLLVVIGHSHSLFLGFRGGRGLATSFGVLFCLLPVPTLLSCFIWAALSFWGLSTRPGALSSAGAMPLFSIPWVWWVQPERVNYLFVVAFLSLWTLYEYRESLMSYMGLRSVAPPPPPPVAPAPGAMPPESLSKTEDKSE
ncbi:MAG: glycerol-3-phosphate acyltransferase [Candidatus Riflebacteria bacterium]|nr:glycerol-3-phosphate acyltransferase [Candidatus Riflebacteria bacterium]